MNLKASAKELPAFGALVLGLAAFVSSVVAFPVVRVDAGMIAFGLATVLFSSYLQVQIPKTRLYFTISDTLVFIAMLVYGGEVAVVLATTESLFTSFNFRRKGINIKTKTLFLNGAIAAITTLATVVIVRTLFDDFTRLAETGSLTDLGKVGAVMALSQFLFNSVLIAFFSWMRDGRPFWKIWNENCLNSLVVFIAGAAGASAVVRAIHRIEPFLVGAAVGLFGLFYFLYRRYLNDIKAAAAKAEEAERERTEQAEKHIVELQHYISEQERIGQELRDSRERFRHAAFHDPLTDLANRNLFIDTLRSLLERSKEQNTKFAVLFLDLNRFKTINDSLGHSAGDRLIVNVAKRLQTLVREGDMVARFGGDEFGIILNNVRLVDDTIQFAESVRRKLLTPFTITGRQVFTSISVGIAFSQNYYEKAEDILRDADIAMCQAKENNKTYAVFDQTMHTRAVTLLQIETDLRHAIENDEMLAYYQPIVDLATMKLTGFEALMRWNHPVRGIVPPNEFIPVAEETNFIVPLTLWILQKSCAQLVEWQQRSPLHKNLMMSVNLSGKHFSQPDIVEQIRWVIKDTGVNPACLKLEITESAIMENAETTIRLLKNLRALGVHLSVDDFGTGYSSLSYLHRFPIDMLKVDRSFVSTMEDGTENGEIVRTIIALAKTLNLRVVAEGIESIHQLHQLRILGCEYGQGYLFSRPVCVEDAQLILDDLQRWQNIIPNNNPATLAQNREFTQLRLMNSQ